MLLGNGVENYLGVTLEVGDGNALAIFNELITVVPGDLGGRLAEDWNVELQSVLSINLDVSEGLGVDVGKH